MYVGGDESSANYFQGYIKQLTVWTDETLTNFPLNTAVDQSRLSFHFNKQIVCDEEMYHTSQFDVGPAYYWPTSTHFGTGWYHVRRLRENSWFYMKDDSGNPLSDVLAGTAVSQTQSEADAYNYFVHAYISFKQQSLTTEETGQYVRYYAPWTVEEYLIVTGDRSAWVRFTATDLQNAVTAGTGLGSYPACINIMATTMENSSPSAIKALFVSSGAEFYVGPYSLQCANLQV
eukprot:TRINITY_DN173_c2_g3_i1.p1 TRINITY_DN173_c2_g3~~TRINITY_DN173_c2_g3_i1.p1  ORF type:complete len:232 (+),score=6.49 TRINITY_DN173_c2_g3_i1:835-1530(+)